MEYAHKGLVTPTVKEDTVSWTGFERVAARIQARLPYMRVQIWVTSTMVN